MITGMKCETCTFGSKCLAKNKLKPFEDGRKVDLGVTLAFTGCKDYRAAKVTKGSELETDSEKEE